MQQLEDDERLWPGAEENGFILDFEEINEKLSTLNGFIDRWVSGDHHCILLVTKRCF